MSTTAVTDERHATEPHQSIASGVDDRRESTMNANGEAVSSVADQREATTSANGEQL